MASNESLSKAAVIEGDDWREDLYVFPVRLVGKDKKPMVAHWREESAPREQWAGRWPKGAAVGIDCAKSGLVVLDDDDLGAVERWLGYRPLTFRVRTPREGGGRHYYFLARPGVPVYNRSAPKQPFPGVDVRGDGGFVVAAGSRHPDGGGYVVEEGHPPIPLPDDVLALLLAPSPDPSTVVDARERFELPEVIEEGRRGDTLFRCACSLEARGLGDAEALPLLRKAWARCDPPYLERTPEAMWAHVVAQFRNPAPGACGHEPSCPTPAHHERLEWRTADRWALSVVEGLADDGRSFEEVSLHDAPEQQPARYFDLGDGRKVVRPGDLVWLHGMNGAAKTPLLTLLGMEALTLDRDGLWVLMDYELGRTRMRQRLLDAGMTPEQIRDSIYYAQFPGLLTDRAKDVLVRGVLDKAARLGKVPRLMTWDTFARSCSRMPGADPEKNAHINAWFTTHADWAKETFEAETGAPLTQYITDHPNKDDGAEPGGGHAKQDRVAINVWVHKGTGFSMKHERGDSALVNSKHAYGDFDRQEVMGHIRNRIGPDGVSRFLITPATTTDAEEVSVDLTKAGTESDDKRLVVVLAKLREAGGQGLLRTDVTGSGGGAGPWRTTVDALVTDGLIVERPDPSSSTARRYWLPSFAPGVD